MINADTFVGAVSMIVGGVCVAAAIFNWPWYFKMRSSRLLERFGGRTGARIIVALLGVGLIALGGAIAFGFMNRSSDSSALPARGALAIHSRV
jgi:small neutral amino acid transporter SnatA (MarC family)